MDLARVGRLRGTEMHDAAAGEGTRYARHCVHSLSVSEELSLAVDAVGLMSHRTRFLGSSMFPVVCTALIPRLQECPFQSVPIRRRCI